MSKILFLMLTIRVNMSGLVEKCYICHPDRLAASSSSIAASACRFAPRKQAGNDGRSVARTCIDRKRTEIAVFRVGPAFHALVAVRDCPRFSRISNTPCGQTSTHLPQPTHFSGKY